MSSETLTDLQLAVLKALWALGEGTVGEIAAAMAREGRDLASTTVATLLQRLRDQGWVEHRKSGRTFIYRAAVNKKQTARSVLDRVLSSFFDGKVSALAAQLLESERVSPEDIEEMRKLLMKKGR